MQRSTKRISAFVGGQCLLVIDVIISTLECGVPNIALPLNKVSTEQYVVEADVMCSVDARI
ncbi:MAG: hypothetical protein AAF511_06935 [Pseudomonadota bacterium]